MLKFCDPSTLSKFFRGILRVWILDYILQLHLWQTGAGIQILSGWLQRFFSKTSHCHFCLSNRYGKFLLLQSEREIRACHTVPHHESKRGRGRQSRVLNWRMTVFLVTFNFCRTKVEAKVSCSWWTSRKNTASHSTGKLAITILVFWRKSPSLLCNIHCLMHGVLDFGNTCKAFGQHFTGNGQQH